jgi:Domain of unknown function (DUF4157)
MKSWRHDIKSTSCGLCLSTFLSECLGFETNERRLTMRTFAQKPKAPQQATTAKPTTPGRAHFGQSHEVNSILHLQRTIGNQAVQQLLGANTVDVEGDSTTTKIARFGHDFSRIPAYAKVPVKTQTKLTVNTPGDVYEQEADRIADQVMATPAYTAVNGAPPRIQRFSGQPNGRMDESGKEEEQPVQTKSQSGARPAATNLGNRLSQRQGSGTPLPKSIKSEMEHSFGVDFSHVNIHTDTEAIHVNQELHAQAFTYGQDVYFNSGKFNPEQTEGKQLLAHELTHVVQQGKDIRPKIQLSRLRDFAGTPQRQAFIIDDKEIEATDEFKAYMNSNLVWQWQDKMTRQEAFLACRLIIEAIQRGEPLKWENDARGFMNRARKLINITKSPKEDCPSSKYKACVKRADIPGGLSNLAAMPGMLAGFFKMEIDWHEDDPNCACCCGEYRQFVRGFIKINGTKQTKKLFNGKSLSETDWNEDSDEANHAYGHRDLSEEVNDKFIPDRKSGCLYRGFDTPGIDDPAVAGKHVEMVLEFKGQTFDRCQKTFGPENLWKLDFKGDVPEIDKGGDVIG